MGDSRQDVSQVVLHGLEQSAVECFVRFLYLPGHGMQIWHVDVDNERIDGNATNNDIAHMCVELKKANNLNLGTTENLAGWCWPGYADSTSFTDFSIPNMRTFDNQLLDEPLTNVCEVDGMVQFGFMDGWQPVFPIRNMEAKHYVADGLPLYKSTGPKCQYWVQQICVDKDL